MLLSLLVSYFFHKSPSKFFSKNSQSKEISTNLRLLHGARQEHFRLLGELITQCRIFDDNASSADQFAWAGCLLSTLQTMCGRPSVWTAHVGTHADFMVAINDVAPVLSRYCSVIRKIIAQAKKPSHLRRYWIEYTSAAAGLAWLVWHVKNNPRQIPEFIGTMRARIIESYYNHLEGPVKRIGSAFGFGDESETIDGSPAFVNQQIGRMRGGMRRMLDNLPESQEQIPAHLQQDYEQVLTRFQEWNNRQKGGVTAVAFDPIDLGDIGVASQTLSSEVFYRAFDHCLDDMSKANVTQKSTVVSQLTSLMKLGRGVVSHRADNVMGGLAESVGAIEEVIALFMVRSDTMMTQNKLTAAALALIPAGLIAWGAYKGTKKFGRLFMPTPYDDTPIKDAIIGARDLLDDCYYLEARDGMAAVHVGKLFYHLTRIRTEMKNINREQRNILMGYLNRVEIADSIEGKQLFLKKMHREYKNWHKASRAA